MAAARKLQPDLAIVDISLREEHDGIELTRQLRNESPDLPVLAVLGLDSEPVWASNGPSGKTSLTSASAFCWWFHDKDCVGAGSTNPYARKVFPQG